MKKQKIKIDIVSDINCPWCYLGDARLKKAISEAEGEYEFNISFKPFELSPNAAPEGQDKQAYYIQNYGKDAVQRIEASSRQLTELGKAEGVVFNFDKSSVVHNTFNGHRLIWLAEEFGVQEQVAVALFEANFTEGKNMNDTAVLTEIGVANGIPAERLQDFFSSEEGKKEVKELEHWAQAAGIRGVPAFIFNDQYLVSGAQPAAALKEFFARVAPVPALEEIKTTGASCNIEGEC